MRSPGAEGLAELGYAALACDIHGDAAAWSADLGEALGLLKPLYADTKRMRARGLAALKALKARKEVDPEAHRLDRLLLRRHHVTGTGTVRRGSEKPWSDSTAGSQPPRRRPMPRPIRAASWSASAPTIRSSSRKSATPFEEEMRSAGVDWQMHLYGGTVHSFTNREADERATSRRCAIRRRPTSDPGRAMQRAAFTPCC